MSEVSAIQFLFLDFDGVMHPDHSARPDNFIHRDTFEAVIRSFTNLDIVISSTWRNTRTLDGLRDLFSPDVAARVIGVNPSYRDLEDVPDSLVGYEREAECQAWLRHHGHATKDWLAIDDRPWNFRPFSFNTFLVDGEIGLDAVAAAALHDRLRVGNRRK